MDVVVNDELLDISVQPVQAACSLLVLCLGGCLVRGGSLNFYYLRLVFFCPPIPVCVCNGQKQKRSLVFF